MMTFTKAKDFKRTAEDVLSTRSRDPFECSPRAQAYRVIRTWKENKAEGGVVSSTTRIRIDQEEAGEQRVNVYTNNGKGFE